MIKNARIGHLYDDVFLLLRPEFMSCLLPYIKLFIPVRFKASKTLMKDFGSRSKMMASYKWPNLRGAGGGGDEGGKGDLNWKGSAYLNGRKYFIQQNSTTGTSDSFSIVLGLKNFSCQTTPKFKMAAVLL